jgi:hypothetical protein
MKKRKKQVVKVAVAFKGVFKVANIPYFAPLNEPVKSCHIIPGADAPLAHRSLEK